MSVNISRTFRFTDGFKYSPAMLESEISNIVETINNANAGLLTWDNVKVDVFTLTGLIPIASGGTNSGTALNNNRFMVSSGGKIVENAAVTASRALASDANGLPVASATTAAELAHVSGVTSAIQTQLNSKAPTASPTFTGTITTPLTSSRALATGGSGELAVSVATSNELSFLSGVTSAIQTQLDAKAASSAIKVVSIGAITTSTTSFSTTSSTFQTTNLSASITPSSASNRVLVIACSTLRVAAAGVNGKATIARGGTNLLSANAFQVQDAGGATNTAVCMAYIDSPATTSSTTYAVQVSNNDGATSVTWGFNSGTQIMILAEIV